MNEKDGTDSPWLSDGGSSAGSNDAPVEEKPKADTAQATSEGRFQDLKTRIDPGLAALVVRQYLLPLFEGRQGKVTNREGLDEIIEQASIGGGPLEGIFGELKLSDQLLDELRQTKQDTNALKIKFFGSEQAQERLLAKVEALKKDIQRGIQALKKAKLNETALRQESAQVESESSLLALQSREMAEEIKKLQIENSRMAARLLEEEGKVERLCQVVAQNENTSSLSQLESDVLQGQVQSLHSRVSGLFGLTKNALDERAFDLAMYEINSTMVDTYCSKIEEELERVNEEKRTLSNEQDGLQASRTLLEAQRKRLTNEYNEQKQKVQADLIKMYDEKEQVRKEKEKLSKKLKELTEDRDKLKQRMKKYRLRRMFDQDTSTCRNCNKDFVKTENFNWSCRTHTSEFGGEMWWCCGKLGTDALGCKFSKHESKDDDDELDEKEKKEKDETEQRIRNLNVKCFGCKDVGHKASNCLRDPNIRTNYNAKKELNRLTQAYDADASKKQLRQIDSRAIASLVNEKIGFVAMKVDPDEPRQPFTELMEQSRVRLRQRREEKGASSSHDAKSSTEPAWARGYQSSQSDETSNTDDSDADFNSSSGSNLSSEELKSPVSPGVDKPSGAPGRFLNFV